MNSAFGANPAAATQMLRRVAARNLGLDAQVVHGTVDEYRELSAADQVRLTDEMARLIARYPAGFTPEVVAEAQARVANPQYGQPLADTSFTGTLIERIANGQLADDAFAGLKQYLTTLALIGGAVLLGYLILTDAMRGSRR